LLPERRNFSPGGTYFPVHLPIRPVHLPDQATMPDRRLEEEHMKFTLPGRLAGTALLGAAAIAVVGATASHASHPPTASLAALSHTRSSSGLASKQARSGLVPEPAGLAVREGRVISSGIENAGGELVFYGVRIHLRELPGTTFGIMAGQRDSSGGLTPEVETNETTGSDTAPGFHAVESSLSVGSPAVAVPEFGYYAGPAAEITAVEGGQQVRADVARWSVNPGIVIFWFPPGTDPGGAPLQDLTASDAAGHQLPAD
jgi:hypothetical protein